MSNTAENKPSEINKKYPLLLKKEQEGPHQTTEGFSEQLVVLEHLLSQLLPVFTAATHKPLLHQRSDVLHRHQPLGLLLQALQEPNQHQLGFGSAEQTWITCRQLRVLVTWRQGGRTRPWSSR